MLALETQLTSTKRQTFSQGKKDRLRVFSGSANLPLSQRIAQYLGIELGPVTSKCFADGEIYIQFQESIRGCDVFLIQPTCEPVNERLMELLIMIDACKRASARKVTAVLPYYGYARADRRTSGRESITAKLASDLIVRAGADRVLAIDLHSPQIQAYFDIPIDHISATPVLVHYLQNQEISNAVVVSPDIGGVSRARAFAKALGGAPLAIIDKRRPVHNTAVVVNVIGEVKGKTAIVVDDIIDTGGTLFAAAHALRDSGASKVLACSSHGVLSEPALPKLSSGVFDEVIMTDTIPVPQEKTFAQLTTLSVSELVGEAIRRIHKGLSVSSMLSS